MQVSGDSYSFSWAHGSSSGTIGPQGIVGMQLAAGIFEDFQFANGVSRRCEELRHEMVGAHLLLNNPSISHEVVYMLSAL